MHQARRGIMGMTPASENAWARSSARSGCLIWVIVLTVGFGGCMWLGSTVPDESAVATASSGGSGSYVGRKMSLDGTLFYPFAGAPIAASEYDMRLFLDSDPETVSWLSRSGALILLF